MPKTRQQELDELDAEIAEMEAELKGQSQQPEADPAQQFEGDQPSGVVQEGDAEFPGADESDVGGQQQPPPEQEVAPQPQESGRVSWKSEFEKLNDRYVKLRQASDHFKFETRRQLATLQEQLLEAEKERDTLFTEAEELRKAANKGSVTSVFTQDDVDVLGEATISNFQKAIDNAVTAATGPLQAELLRLKKQERERLTRDAETNRRSSYMTFEQQLESLVPDFRQLNGDKGFLKWLNEVSPYSGAVRFNLLRKAEANGDVERVAQLFLEYKQLTQQAPNQLMAESASPIGQAGGGQPQQPPTPEDDPNKKVYSWSEINAFYDDDIAGKFRNKVAERDKLDAIYDRAIKEGRVQ